MAFLIYYCSCLILLVLFSHYIPEKSIASESHNFLTIDIGALSPAATVCTSHRGRDTSTKHLALQLFHRAGPCSPTDHPQTTKTDDDMILSNDQSRVDFIRARSLGDTTITPAQSLHPLINGHYAVTMGLGTPRQNVTLLFDTGSSVTWTQCRPCAGHCFPQVGPLYDPRSSTTYSEIPCNSPQCSNLGYNLSCFTGPCVYNMLYGDGSISVGTVSKDTLAIAANDGVFRDFVFGCGQKNQGSFPRDMDGMLGLGPDPFNGSFLYQTASRYGQWFSYCLGSTTSSTGHLTFGKTKYPKNVRFTPLTPDPYFYRVEIVAISVGGTRLPINLAGFKKTVIDSGTVISSFPMDAYAAMRDAFKKHMVGYKMSGPMFGGLFDTCFDFGGHKTMTIPEITFTFKGGAEVELDSSGIFYPATNTVACLAFVGTSDPESFPIFGNTQQKTFEVVYDVAGGKIGFGQKGCK